MSTISGIRSSNLFLDETFIPVRLKASKKINSLGQSISLPPQKQASLSAKTIKVMNPPKETSAKRLQRNIDKMAQRPSLQRVREELAKKLNDIERVDKIMYDYATILKDKIPDAHNKQLFEQWMVGIAYFLGSPFYNHELFFKHQASNPFFSTNKEFKTAFRKFSRAIQCHAAPLHKTVNTARKVKNIAILYPGSGGGGHKSPANAMAKHLEKNGYKVKLLDSDEFERPYDPKVGGLTRGEIFSKIYQQEGNTAKAYQMWDEGNKKQPLRDRRYMKDLTNAIRDFKADHLFVVAHHQPENTSLAYQLGIPTTYVHTDNEFHCNLQEVCLNQQELKKPLVNFTSLSNNSNFYHYLLSREGQEHYNNLPENVRKQMVLMNFPVRESFHAVTKEQKQALRRDLNIPEESTVVKVAMGANGIPADIKKIMEEIKNEAHTAEKPLYVLVVCGANKELKAELDLLQEVNNADDNVRFRILGHLDEKEMSDYDKTTDVWITKPGGSTTAEAENMRKQMLYVPNFHHGWELTNARKLEPQNLAEERKPDVNIVDQIDRRAQIGAEVEHQKIDKESWMQQLVKIVKRVASPLLSVAT